MFGGTLSDSLIVLNKQYIVPFGSTLYSFNTKGQITQAHTLHKDQIVAIHQYPDTKNILSIDIQGNYILSNSHHIIYTHHLNLTVNKALVHEDNIIFTTQNQLYYHNTKLKKPNNKLKYQAAGKIAFIHKTQEYLLVGQLNQLHIFSLDEGKLLKVIQHSNLITCADVYNKDVVIGDQKGKINFFFNGVEEGEVQTTQKHWHTGRVNSVILRQGNLISAGEEGVVVFWHLATEKKDFLPRFGSEIRHLVIDEDKNRLCSFLSDNSVKVVLLDSDKSIVYLKTIINPNSSKTKRTSIQTYKFLAGAQYLPNSNLVCLNSTPGKLQFVSLFKGHFDLDVSNRNTISRLDDDYPNPIEVKCVSFSKDQNTLAVYANNISTSYLKIFSKNQQYELVTKINNPHINEMIQIVSYECSKDMTTKFVSIGTDKLLKVWKEKLSQKKSLKQQNEVIWTCQSRFSHKNRQFTAIQPIQLPTGNAIGITLADHHFILLNINSGQIVHEIYLQGLESSFYLGSTIAYHTQNLFAICDYSTKKNLFSLNTFVKKFSVSPSEKTIAVVHQFNDHKLLSLIQTKKKKDINVTKSYKLKGTQAIESIFWKDQTPIAVTSSLHMIGFGKSDLFNTQTKKIIQTDIEQQQEENQFVSFTQKSRNLFNKRIYSNEVQKEVHQLMETIKDLPQVGNRFRLLANILLE